MRGTLRVGGDKIADRAQLIKRLKKRDLEIERLKNLLLSCECGKALNGKTAKPKSPMARLVEEDVRLRRKYTMMLRAMESRLWPVPERYQIDECEDEGVNKCKQE